MTKSLLPLYALYLLDRERHGHMEVSTRGIIGCFESHVKVWGMVDQTSLLLQVDAIVVDDFDKRLQRVPRLPWDIQMLTDRPMRIEYYVSRSVDT